MQSFEVCRLSEKDIPAICDLLSRTWSSLYGETGCPAFSEKFLLWLYGGPDASEHLLLGCREDGKLLGFKANLSRAGVCRGQPLRAHIATHLAIEPDVDLGMRFELARYLSLLHPLSGEAGGRTAPKDALSLAFLENAKPLAQSASRIHAAQGIRTESTVFQQAVVDRFTLRARALSPDVRLRPATTADSATLHALLGGMTVSGFCWRPSLEAMAHHYHAAPDARVWLAERDGQPVGFLAGYTLEWLRRGAVSRMFIVETLVARDDLVAVSLLVEASTHAVAEKLRGVVIENPTYLGLEDPAACGVILTPRRMLAVARTVDQAEGLVGSFFCDIK